MSAHRVEVWKEVQWDTGACHELRDDPESGQWRKIFVILKCPVQFLLRCSDGEVVQDNITFRVGVILGFGQVPLRLAYKFILLVRKVIRGGVVELGLVFKIFDDLKAIHRIGRWGVGVSIILYPKEVDSPRVCHTWVIASWVDEGFVARLSGSEAISIESSPKPH